MFRILHFHVCVCKMLLTPNILFLQEHDVRFYDSKVQNSIVLDVVVLGKPHTICPEQPHRHSVSLWHGGSTLPNMQPFERHELPGLPMCAPGRSGQRVGVARHTKSNVTGLWQKVWEYGHVASFHQFVYGGKRDSSQVHEIRSEVRTHGPGFNICTGACERILVLVFMAYLEALKFHLINASCWW